MHLLLHWHAPVLHAPMHAPSLCSLSITHYDHPVLITDHEAAQDCVLCSMSIADDDPAHYW
eukprot:360150-Pelagomonas_calceolata.AAC.17